MDRIENPNVSGARLEAPPPSGSQSKVSPVILWVLLAAALFRIVTTVTDKGESGGGAGLVRWTAPESAVDLARSQLLGRRAVHTALDHVYRLACRE